MPLQYITVLVIAVFALPVLAEPCHPLETLRAFAPDGSIEDDFGWSVAVDGDSAVVGAPLAGEEGRAYFYARTGGEWQFRQIIANPRQQPNPNDRFGETVDIQGGLAVVGGTAFDGRAWVFDLSTGTAAVVSELSGDDDENTFGSSVDIEGDWIAVGSVPACYLFRRDGDDWVRQQRITAPFGNPDPDNINFGERVAMSGGRLFVGAYRDNSAGSLGGAVFAFELSGDVWEFAYRLLPFEGSQFGRKLTADDATLAVASGSSFVSVYELPADQLSVPQTFSMTVSSMHVDGETLLIGRNTLTLPHDPDVQSGGATILRRDGDEWVAGETLFPAEPTDGGAFGVDVHVDHGSAIVGSPRADFGPNTLGAVHFAQLRCGEGCAADLVHPYQVLDLSDINAFVTSFGSADPLADFADPVGVWDLADVSAFVAAFVAGCP